jgi:hypothetical protein
MTAKSVAKNAFRAACENKYSGPVIKTAAVPVLVVAYPIVLVNQLKHEYNH